MIIINITIIVAVVTTKRIKCSTLTRLHGHSLQRRHAGLRSRRKGLQHSSCYQI